MKRRLVLLAVGLFYGFRRWGYVMFGQGNEPHFDYVVHYSRVAEAVISGVPLYIGTAIDNKPPLFMFTLVLAHLPPMGYLVSLLLTGLANGLVAVLLMEWRGRDVGFVAGLLYLSLLPLVMGDVVNVRSFALVGLLGALVAGSWSRRGALVAIGGMFSQYTILPALLLFRRSLRSAEDAGRFVLGGVAVLIVSYGTVLAVWGPQSFLNSLVYSVGVSDDYVRETAVHSPLTNPVYWLGNNLYVAGALAGIGLLAVFAVRDDREAGTLAILCSLPVLVRALPYYWVFPLPFVAVLAAEGGRKVLTNGLGAE